MPRRDVFTPARLAASMKNLEKANAAPPEKRNRFTMTRLLARYALLHAKLGIEWSFEPYRVKSQTQLPFFEDAGLKPGATAAMYFWSVTNV